MFIGRMVGILVVIAGVIVVDVYGMHVRGCRSLFKLTGTCMVVGILPG